MSDPSTDEDQDQQGEEERRPVDATPDDDEIEQIEQEREERLDPDNRPDNAEVDNTDREFDERVGRFKDSEAPEDGEEKVFATSEDEESA